MAKEVAVETNEQEKEKIVYKRSELLERQKELEKAYETLVKEMQEREYTISFDNRKVFNRLIKFLETDAPWGHTTATGLIMLYNNLIEQKNKLRQETKWIGDVNLRSAGITVLWSMVTKMQGSGFHQAKNFVELMANIGQSLSEAVQKSHEDNAKLREVHSQLSEIDNQLSNPETINDVIDEKPKEKTLKEQVNPEVE